MPNRGSYPEFYPNLSGSVVELKDGIKNKRSDVLSGKKVLLLGTATDGPVLQNVNIQSYENGENLYGRYYDRDTGVFNGSTLTRGLDRVLGAGADNVDCMRISGKKATGELELESVVREISHQEREYTVAEGNERTVIDMNLPEMPNELFKDNVQYDYAYMDNVKVFGDGKMLPTTSFQIDNTAGEVILREDVTSTLADVDIEYDLIYVNIKRVPEIIEVTATNQELTDTDGLGITFQVPLEVEQVLSENPEDPIVESPSTEYGDTIQVFEDGTNITNDMTSLNYETGEINFGSSHTGTISANYVYKTETTWEVPEQTAENEFRLEHNKLVSGSETIKVDIISGSVKELAANEYSIDYSSGLITIYDMENYSGVNGVSYEYKETSIETKAKTDKANGAIQSIYLKNTADSAKPLIVTSNGNELPGDAYRVNYNSMDTTVVELKPGYASLRSDIYVKYYWKEQKMVRPVINAESVFGGSKYNDVKFEIIDKIVEKTDRFYVSRSGDLIKEETGTYKFPGDDTNILADSLYIEDNSGTVLELGSDFTLHADVGKITLNSGVTVTQPVTANYAIAETESRKVTVVRGEYDPTVNEDGEDGGGMYKWMLLQKGSDNKTFTFRNDNLVKGYFFENPGHIMLVNDKDGTETQLSDTDKDYFIDYAAGQVKFKDTVEQYERVRVKQYEYYNVASKTLKIIKPEDKYQNNNRTPIVIENIGPEINTVGQLVNVVNTHERNNVVRLSVDNEFVSMSALDLKTPVEKILNDGSINFTRVRLTGGSNEVDLSKEELFEKLGGRTDDNGNLVQPGAYDVVMDIEDVDIVLPLGVYADDQLLSNYKSFAGQLANFCARCFIRNNEIRGVIGLNPLNNPTQLNIINRVRELSSLETDFYMYDQDYNFVRNKDNNRIDIGKYLTLVGYDKVYSDQNLAVPSLESGAADFAAIASMVGPQTSPTNERTSYGKLAYNYSTNQASQLVNNKIVPAKIKRGSAKILDAITCAQPQSGWTRYFTVDIVFDTIDELRDIFDKYIGKSNTLEHRASLNSDIRDALKKKGTLIDYDYSVVMDPNDPSMGRILIELDLVPAGELQKIKTVVSINALNQ